MEPNGAGTSINVVYLAICILSWKILTWAHICLQVVFDKQGVASMSGKTWLKRNSKPLWEGVRHVRLSLLKALKAAYSSDDPDVRR